MAQDPKKPQPPKKAPPPKPRPKPRPPIESGPDQILRERRRLSTPMKDQTPGLGIMESDMQKKVKGLGFSANGYSTDRRAVNPSPGSENRRPHIPGTGKAKTMPYTPGTGQTKKLPYRPKTQSYDSPTMDMGWDSDKPPAYATMEYDPARDGSAYEDMPSYDGGGVGAEELGKQEDNKDWKYENWRSEQGDPVPEDQANIYNDLFDEWDRKRPVTGSNENPTEVAQWERSARAAAKAAGLSDEEIERLIDDLYGDYQ